MLAYYACWLLQIYMKAFYELVVEHLASKASPQVDRIEEHKDSFAMCSLWKVGGHRFEEPGHRATAALENLQTTLNLPTEMQASRLSSSVLLQQPARTKDPSRIKPA